MSYVGILVVYRYIAKKQFTKGPISFKLMINSQNKTESFAYVIYSLI